MAVIQEDFCLPSMGKAYNKPFDPHFRMRSMTVMDEMKRLQFTENQYKLMCEIIDDCIVDKFPISSYDMCFFDYIYLLHKLRVVTYGSEYTMTFICPVCGNIETLKFNLDDLKIKKFDESIKDNMTIKLPANGDIVKLRFQTPRDLDNISRRAKEMKENFPDMKGDPTYLLTLESFIDKINDIPVNHMTLLEDLKKLSMKDTNYLSKKAVKLQESAGIDTIINAHCSKCGNDVKTTFRYTSEFFGPEVD